MLRFRNRFTAQPSELRKCAACGRGLSRAIGNDRETLIHELPWCPRFEAIVAEALVQPDVALHTALVSPQETMVVADGDTPADVRNPF